MTKMEKSRGNMGKENKEVYDLQEGKVIPLLADGPLLGQQRRRYISRGKSLSSTRKANKISGRERNCLVRILPFKRS